MTTTYLHLAGIPGVTGVRWSSEKRAEATLGVDGWTWTRADGSGNVDDHPIWGIVISWAWLEGERIYLAEIHAFGPDGLDDICATTPAAVGSPRDAIQGAIANLPPGESITIDDEPSDQLWLTYTVDAKAPGMAVVTDHRTPDAIGLMLNHVRDEAAESGNRVLMTEVHRDLAENTRTIPMDIGTVVEI